MIDTSGNLLGINSAIYSRSGGSLGIGFAIPVSTVKTVMDAIISKGQVIRGWIGVEPRDITPELAENLSLGREEGVIIAAVLKNGPADKAGVKPGDILVSVEGQTISNMSEMFNLIAKLKPDSKRRLSSCVRARNFRWRLSSAKGLPRKNWRTRASKKKGILNGMPLFA